MLFEGCYDIVMQLSECPKEAVTRVNGMVGLVSLRDGGTKVNTKMCFQWEKRKLQHSVVSPSDLNTGQQYCKVNVIASEHALWVMQFV